MDQFWMWWQHLPERIDPVIFQIGSFRLQYYGLMYLVAFTVAYGLAAYRLKTEARWHFFSVDHLQGLITAVIIGLILGARLGYVIFYNPSYYAAHPLEIFLPFEIRNGFRFTGISGMSYHGGLIGALIGLLYYSRKYGLGTLNSVDLLAPCGAAGYTFGRIGNFINGELWGRVTTAPIGMYFPQANESALRHPSQLYEAFGEGILLFIILWALRFRAKTPGAMLALYLIGYGTVRFIIEFFRQPDAHLGFVLFSLSMGQILCAIMILAGIFFYWLFKRQALRDAR
ncbi:MAG: diacylglyceryl transferase [Desulfatitalea sp. BRH_c12]|nr:MAG: diacylglyceryl transferase [Desulfatitalea sp. BRH_c12]